MRWGKCDGDGVAGSHGGRLRNSLSGGKAHCRRLCVAIVLNLRCNGCFGVEGRQLALVDHALEDWRGVRLDFLKPVLEGYGFAIDLEVVEAFLGRSLP